MGGRGGSSGVSAKGRNETFKPVESFPKLKGNAADISKGTERRDSIAPDMFEHAIYFRDVRGYDVDGASYLDAVQTGQRESFTIEQVRRAPRDRRDAKRKHVEENFHSVGRRISNLNKLFSNKSASFWANTSVEDLKKYIDKK